MSRTIRKPQSVPCAVAFVTEPAHEGGERLASPIRMPSGSHGRAREPVTWNGRADHVERIAPVTSVRGRIRKRSEHLEELHDRPRETVREQQGKGIGTRRADVIEMQVRPVHRGSELRILVEPGLLRTPVVGIEPVVGELLQIAERNAVRPANAG